MKARFTLYSLPSIHSVSRGVDQGPPDEEDLDQHLEPVSDPAVTWVNEVVEKRGVQIQVTTKQLYGVEDVRRGEPIDSGRAPVGQLPGTTYQVDMDADETMTLHNAVLEEIIAES